jgi:hypothetical protein
MTCPNWSIARSTEHHRPATLTGDRSDPGEINCPSSPVVSGALCGDVDLDLGRAASVGEARIPAAEAVGQVIVEDSGADLDEELGSGR